MNAPVSVRDITILTPRLRLRGWRGSDLDDFYAYASVDGVGQAAGWMPHKSIGESKEILTSFMEEDHSFAIESLKDNRVIGSLDVKCYGEEKLTEFSPFRGRELGFALSRDCWGQGLMTEAVRAVIDWAFDTLDLDFLLYGHFTENERSRRVQEKCGFLPYRHICFTDETGMKREGFLNFIENPRRPMTIERVHSETLLPTFSPSLEARRLRTLLSAFADAQSPEDADKYRNLAFSVFPILFRTENYDQGHEAHPYDLWMHTLVTLTGIPRDDRQNDPVLLLAALFHDIGKPDTRTGARFPRDRNSHYPGHPIRSEELTRTVILPRLRELGMRLPEAEEERLAFLVRHHDDPLKADRAFLRPFRAEGMTFREFRAWMLLEAADADAHAPLRNIVHRKEVAAFLAGDGGERLWNGLCDR